MSEMVGGSEQIFSAIFEAMDEGAICHREDGSVFAVNPAAERLFGIARETLAGISLDEFVERSGVLDERGSLLTLSQYPVFFALCTGSAPPQTTIGLKKAGSVLKVSVRTLICESYVVALFKPLPAEKPISLEKSHLIEMFEESVDFVGMADMQGRLLYHNQAARRMLGLPRNADMSQMGMADVHPPWAYDTICQQVLPEVIERGVWRGESVLLHSDGHEIPVSQLVMLHKDEEGKPCCTSTIMEDIGERKRAERALLDAHDFFYNIIDSVVDPIFVKDRQHRWIHLNDAACKLFGASRRELIGKSDFDFFPEHQAKLFWEGDDAVFKSGEVFNIDEDITNILGETRHIRTRKNCFLDTYGNPVLVGIIYDETESRRMKDALAAREREFRSLAENSPDNIARYDLKGRLIYLNPRLEHTLSGLPGWPKGIERSESLPEYDVYFQAILKVGLTGEPVNFELQLPGEPARTHLIHMVAERNQDDEITSVLAIGRDITERKQMESDLLAREQELRALAESSPGMMGSYHMRPDGSVCMPYVSPNIRELFGLSPEDVLEDATPLMRLNHPDDTEFVRTNIAESARTMQPWRQEYRILHPERGLRWMEGHTNPVPHPEGGIVWYGYVHDITEQKRAETIEQRFAHLLQNSFNEIYLFDAHTLCFLQVSAGGKDNLGYTEAELLVLTPLQITPSYTVESFEALIAPLRSGEHKTLLFETKHRRKDGTTYPVEVRLQLMDAEPPVFMAVVRDITERRRAEQQASEFAAHLQIVREEEKARIALEIHDELGSTLTALKMETYLMGRELSADENSGHRLSSRVETMTKMLAGAIISMRGIIADLRPAILDDLGLMEALRWQSGQFYKRTGIRCDCVCLESACCMDKCGKDSRCEARLDNHVSINLFRIFQESLANVERHSCASRVEVDFLVNDQEVMLSIRDNGVGLSDEYVIAPNSYGMRGMKERARQMDGRIVFDSAPGAGMQVKVSVPVKAAH